MTSHIGEYIRTRRCEKGLTIGQLARHVGYKNVGKGANRLHQLETGGEVHRDLLSKLIEALGLDPAVVAELIEQDRDEALRAWNEWADQPTRPHLVVRLIPGVYMSVEIPDDALEPIKAEAFACDYARSGGRKVCLILTRRLSMWIDEEGKVTGRTEAKPHLPNVRYMTLRGGSQRFLFRGSKEAVRWRIGGPPPRTP